MSSPTVNRGHCNARPKGGKPLSLHPSFPCSHLLFFPRGGSMSMTNTRTRGKSATRLGEFLSLPRTPFGDNLSAAFQGCPERPAYAHALHHRRVRVPRLQPAYAVAALPPDG